MGALRSLLLVPPHLRIAKPSHIHLHHLTLVVALPTIRAAPTLSTCCTPMAQPNTDARVWGVALVLLVHHDPEAHLPAVAWRSIEALGIAVMLPASIGDPVAPLGLADRRLR